MTAGSLPQDDPILFFERAVQVDKRCAAVMFFFAGGLFRFSLTVLP